MPKECLEHVWDLFVWVYKNRMDDFFIFFYFLEEKSAESLSYRGQNNPSAEMSAFV